MGWKHLRKLPAIFLPPPFSYVKKLFREVRELIATMTKSLNDKTIILCRK